MLPTNCLRRHLSRARTQRPPQQPVCRTPTQKAAQKSGQKRPFKGPLKHHSTAPKNASRSNKKAPKALKKPLKTSLYGAADVPHASYPSIASYLSFFSRYADHTKNLGMHTFTTILHRTSDTQHPLVMLTSGDGNKYLFGKIAEGLQRVLNENRVRLSRLRSVFLTGTIDSWSHIGGLPGLFLTISDATKNNIDVFSASSRLMSYVIATWRYFVFRKGVELRTHQADGIIADKNVICFPIKVAAKNQDPAPLSETVLRQITKLVSLMFPRDTSIINSLDPQSYKSDPSETEIQTHVALPPSSSLFSAKSQESLSLLVRFLPLRGKFDPVRAKELGIKPGADFSKLTQGTSVQNADGIWVRPEQVLGKSVSLKKVLILDIPSNEYTQNTLLKNEFFDKNADLGDEDIGLVYHFLGEDVVFDLPEYLEFLQKFPSDCQHVISHPKLADDTLVFRTFAITLLKLKCLQNDSFNLPHFEPHSPLDETTPFVAKLQLMQNFQVDMKGISRDDSLIMNDTWSSLYDEHIRASQLENVMKEDVISSEPIPLGLVENLTLKDQVQVVTLGTGSALPAIHRNVISTLVRVPQRQLNGEASFRLVLLDAGENTLGTMRRNFGHNGLEQLTTVFKELSLIHLSHLHADHHLGIISILNKWFEVNRGTEKIYLVVPWQYNNFVTEWYNLEGRTSSSIDLARIVYLSCEEFMLERKAEFKQVSIDEFESKFDRQETERNVRAPLAPRNTSLIQQLYNDLGINSIQTVRAIHCYWAYSISIDFQLDEKESFKVSYSGDTRPNPRFAVCGHGSDLLIHESSLDNGLIEEAISKKHSTMIEAIAVGQLMDCPKVILTHFSTRYSDKANVVANTTELARLAANLTEYMNEYVSKENIFTFDTGKPKRALGDMETCFAFDMMTVRYKTLGHQRTNFEMITEMVEARSEETEADRTKRERGLAKQEEKREAKREQRLAFRKKRRKSAE